MHRLLAASHLFLLAVLLPGLTLGQTTDRKSARSDAKADARADAKGQDTSRRSHTRRVVVINGETVVDEETVDGKPVRGKRAPKGRRGPAPVPLPDLDRLLKDIERDLPAAARGQLRRAAKNGGSSGGSYSRRVVVKNGETVVDEEIVDGKPVKGRRGKPAPVGGVDLDELMRGLERDLPKDARDMLERSRRDAGVRSKSDSTTKRGSTSRGRSTPKRGAKRDDRPATDGPLRPIRKRDRGSSDSGKTGAQPLRRADMRRRRDV